MNVSQIVQYKKQIEGQKDKKGKLVNVEGMEEWEIKKILNKRKMRGVNRYLVRWKGFTAENDTWEKKKDLGHTRDLVDEFKERLGAEVRKQKQIEQKKDEKLNPRTDEFKRIDLPGKYTAKLLYGWNDKKFEEEYLRKLEKNWNRWKNDRQIDENKYLRKIEEREEEENRKINKRD